jgi:hypothetical protein
VTQDDIYKYRGICGLLMISAALGVIIGLMLGNLWIIIPTFILAMVVAVVDQGIASNDLWPYSEMRGLYTDEELKLLELEDYEDMPDLRR